jgi:hypothetical protein
VKSFAVGGNRFNLCHLTLILTHLKLGNDDYAYLNSRGLCHQKEIF